MAAEYILCVQRRVNPAFLLVGEELFLAMERECWPSACGSAVISRPVAGCSIGSRVVGGEAADVMLMPGFQETLFWRLP